MKDRLMRLLAALGAVAAWRLLGVRRCRASDLDLTSVLKSCSLG